MTASVAPPAGTVRRPWRSISLLAVSQALSASNQAIVIAVAALTATALAPDPALATIPMTATILGLALFAVPATRTIYRFGRRPGFMFGAAIAAVAGLLAAFSVWAGLFWLFCFALFLVGCAGAFVQQYRFAIADSVPVKLKARAISMVLLGGVASAFIGPRLALFGKDLLAGHEFAGSYLAITTVSVLAIIVLAFIRLAPVRRPQAGEPAGRTTGQLLRSPPIFVPVLTAMLSYALMTFVMVAAPLAMVVVCGYSAGEAGTAIQWHIVAMFLPSLVTGSIIARLGASTTVSVGLLLIIACAFVNLNGITVPHFDIALILLGLGWNLGFIGSTSMLAAAYTPQEAGRAQALNEPLVFGSMAVASIFSGVLLHTIGWQALNVLVIPVGAAGLALLAWQRFQTRPATA